MTGRKRLQILASAFRRERWWAIPTSFWLAATGFATAHAYLAWGSYLRSRAFGWLVVPRLLAGLYVEFAVAAVIATWSYRRRWLRSATLVSLAVLLLVNCLQLVANVYSSEFISAAVVRLTPLIGQMISAGSVAIVMVGVLASMAVLVTGFRLACAEQASVTARALATCAISAWCAAMSFGARDPALQQLRARYGLHPDLPVVSLVRAVREAFTASEAVPTPSAEQLAAARQAGIVIAPHSPTPLRKDWVYQKPLPFPKRAGATAKPNVIVFFYESWSALVLGPYNPELAAVTPHLNDFAQHAMRVDDYVNHTIPTVTGLRGQLCSMFPGLSYSPWRAAEKPRVGRVLCLPHVLNDVGYESVYLNHGAASETHFDAQTIDWGFRRAYFSDRVLADLLQGEAPGYKEQASDQQMMRATIALLERRRQRPNRKPLLLAVSTIETHTGHRSNLTYGNGKNRVLNTFYNLDNAFGLFWDWYQKSDWAKDSILIVTGDHVLYPQDDLRKVAGPRHLNERFDYLGLFIMDPTHELPASYVARSSSLDFAPSVMQLLDLPARMPNPFMGLSMFSDRQATPLALGFNYGKQLLVWDRKQSAPEIFASMPEAGRPRALFDVLRYSQALESDNRIWLLH